MKEKDHQIIAMSTSLCENVPFAHARKNPPLSIVISPYYVASENTQIDAKVILRPSSAEGYTTIAVRLDLSKTINFRISNSFLHEIDNILRKHRTQEELIFSRKNDRLANMLIAATIKVVQEENFSTLAIASTLLSDIRNLEAKKEEEHLKLENNYIASY